MQKKCYWMLSVVCWLAMGLGICRGAEPWTGTVTRSVVPGSGANTYQVIFTVTENEKLLSLTIKEKIPAGYTVMYDGKKNAQPTFFLIDKDLDVPSTIFYTLTGNAATRSGAPLPYTLQAACCTSTEVRSLEIADSLQEKTVTSCTILGGDSIPFSGKASFICRITFSDNNTADVAAVWSLDSESYATVNAHGELANNNQTNQTQTVTLFANYSHGSHEAAAAKVVTLEQQRKQLLPLTPGWNLVTPTLTPDATSAAVLSGLAPMRYEVSARCYVRSAEVVAGEAYWL